MIRISPITKIDNQKHIAILDTSDNNSPKLVFEPSEEDEKDFTQVTAYINEEFAEIRLEEKGKEKGNTTPKTTQKTTQKTRDVILQLMKENPEISQEEMSARIGISVDGVKYHIKKLHRENIRNDCYDPHHM